MRQMHFNGSLPVHAARALQVAMERVLQCVGERRALDESLHEPGVEGQALDAADTHVGVGVAVAARLTRGTDVKTE